MTFPAPTSILLLEQEVALLWPDGREDYIEMEFLRANSPSAENVGEADLFGRVHGGDPRTHYPGVRVDGYSRVGNYGIRFLFSDGHQTGIYAFSLLRQLADASPPGAEEPDASHSD